MDLAPRRMASAFNTTNLLTSPRLRQKYLTHDRIFSSLFAPTCDVCSSAEGHAEHLAVGVAEEDEHGLHELLAHAGLEAADLEEHLANGRSLAAKSDLDLEIPLKTPVPLGIQNTGVPLKMPRSTPSNTRDALKNFKHHSHRPEAK